MKIDAHQHFWKYSPHEYGWIDPTWTQLKQDRLPEHLAPLLYEARLDGTVAVQARQTLQETAWLLQLADEYAFIKGVVGWVDLCSPDVDAQLRRFAGHPKFKGVRHVVQDEPDDDFMLRSDFQRGLSLLAEYGLTYDILIFPRHLPVAVQLVERFPEQPFVLDHLAKPFIRDGLLEPWAGYIRQLARHPNVYCKVSGMVTEADWHGWQPQDFGPYLDVVFDAFGCDRLMFGSDWPVCTLAATYGQVRDVVADYASSLSAQEQAALWGETALRFYGLEKMP
ncbi:MAG: amidohydrolase [Caldilineae bacterium]|nr:MAG: amidohydrolase [Caldilineae bacterium]